MSQDVKKIPVTVLFLLYFYSTTVLSHCDFFQGKIGLLSPGKASCNCHATQPGKPAATVMLLNLESQLQQSRYSTYSACGVF